MDNPFDLSDKAGMVTGAGRGLGRAMAMGLAEAGASVLVSDVEAPEDTVYEINEETEGEATGEPVDVTDRGQVRDMVEMTGEVYEGVDFLVNNAGIFRQGDPESMTYDDWFDVLEVNLTGQYHCARAAGQRMIAEDGGSIVNIASVAGLKSFPDSVSYNVSKGGSLQLTRSLADEWARHDIRVNAICPGIFKTGMTDEFIESDDMQNMIENRVPMQRFAVPEELAPTAVYLVSDASGYVTGEHVVVDGGWTCGL